MSLVVTKFASSLHLLFSSFRTTVTAFVTIDSIARGMAVKNVVTRITPRVDDCHTCCDMQTLAGTHLGEGHITSLRTFSANVALPKGCGLAWGQSTQSKRGVAHG